MNGMGPRGEEGRGITFGYGGTGYGAGAGAGGFLMKTVNVTSVKDDVGGGVGVSGIVYIEWD